MECLPSEELCEVKEKPPPLRKEGKSAPPHALAVGAGVMVVVVSWERGRLVCWWPGQEGRRVT